MTKLWVSTRKFTCQVNLRDGIVTNAAPILRKFVGQQWGNLERWCKGVGGLIVREL